MKISKICHDLKLYSTIVDQYNAKYGTLLELTPHQIAFLDGCMDLPAVMARCNRGGGKTWLAALAVMILVTFFYHLGGRGRMRATVVAGAEDQTGTLKDYLVDLVELPIFKSFVKKVYQTGIYLNSTANNSYIRCFPASIKQVRSKRSDLIVFEETTCIDEEIITSCLPQLVGSDFAHIICTFTPMGREKWAFRQEKANGKYKVYSWIYTDCPWITPDFAQMMHDSISERNWRRDFLAEWVDDPGIVFSADALDEAIIDATDLSHVKETYQIAVLGIDWAERHNSAIATIFIPHNLLHPLLVVNCIQGIWQMNETRNKVLFECNRLQAMDLKVVVVSESCPLTMEANRLLKQQLYESGNINFYTEPMQNRKATMVALTESILEHHHLLLLRPNLRLLIPQLYIYKKLISVESGNVSKNFAKGEDDCVDALLHAISGAWNSGALLEYAQIMESIPYIRRRQGSS